MCWKKDTSKTCRIAVLEDWNLTPLPYGIKFSPVIKCLTVNFSKMPLNVVHTHFKSDLLVVVAHVFVVIVERRQIIIALWHPMHMLMWHRKDVTFPPGSID